MTNSKLKIIGHRGAKGLAPENTLAGFRKALEHRVDGIEFDVRVTQDGVAILIHDDVVHDAAGTAVNVHTHSFDELHAHSPELFTLDGALEYVPAQTMLVVEVKPGENVHPIVVILQKHIESGKFSPDNLLLASFSYRTLKALHKALPECQIVVNEQWSGMWATWQAKRLGTKRITMQQRWLWRGFIAPMARRGWLLSAYTVNNPKQAKRWASYGLYAVVTDFPDSFEN